MPPMSCVMARRFAAAPSLVLMSASSASCIKASESVYGAGLREEPFTPILRQVRKIPGPPTNDRETEGHRLTPDRPVRLTKGGKPKTSAAADAPQRPSEATARA